MQGKLPFRTAVPAGTLSHLKKPLYGAISLLCSVQTMPMMTMRKMTKETSGIEWTRDADIINMEVM
ncbi:hypothetical protein CLV97_12113 [Planifilum fimeticola]|jgi:hypothetical protein|uniref:Uncharacterized protein n=1 Tax=Planifilum fimeticola TaxID=201975 RepID=A0A2T0LCK4_9BACL|nr:hypothetical protein CLV97_12113 [Planifilum fimeticola]